MPHVYYRGSLPKTSAEFSDPDCDNYFVEISPLSLRQQSCCRYMSINPSLLDVYNCRMKTFQSPSISPLEQETDSEGKVWVSCIRCAQIFLVLLSFTVIHHITNPFHMRADYLTALTAALCATECACVVIYCTYLCLTKKDQKDLSVRRLSTDSVHPSDYSIHPVYFI